MFPRSHSAWVATTAFALFLFLLAYQFIRLTLSDSLAFSSVLTLVFIALQGWAERRRRKLFQQEVD